MLYIVQNKPDLRTGDFCGIISGCGNVSSELTDWTIKIDGNKPPLEPKPTIPVTKLNF